MIYKSVFAKKFDWPALIYAANDGNKEIVELLLHQKGIDTNIHDILK